MRLRRQCHAPCTRIPSGLSPSFACPPDSPVRTPDLRATKRSKKKKKNHSVASKKKTPEVVSHCSHRFHKDLVVHANFEDSIRGHFGPCHQKRCAPTQVAPLTATASSESTCAPVNMPPQPVARCLQDTCTGTSRMAECTFSSMIVCFSRMFQQCFSLMS